jgi:lipopolysaccharide export system protein LptC
VIRRPSLQLLLIMLLLSLRAYLWDPSDERYPDMATAERQQRLPKNYLEDIRTWSFNEQGQLTEVLDAKQAEYFLASDETELSEPRFYSHHSEDRTWSASAMRGRLQNDTQELDLYENVILSSDQTGGRLATEELNINLVTRMARTEVPVLVTQGSNETRADGLIADLEQERMEMAPNVESIYVQPSP